MDAGRLKIEPLHDRFAARVPGVDAADALREAGLARAIVDAAARHGVVLLPRQRLSEREMSALARGFGIPLPGYRREFTHPEFPELVLLGNIRDGHRVVTYLNTQGVEWHSDSPGSIHPPGVTLLHCVETPARGGDTLFASTVAACASLPGPLAARIDNVVLVHNFDVHNDRVAGFHGTNVRPREHPERRTSPDTRDPIVQVHPATGARHLYVSHQMVREVIGLGPEDGAALVADVVAHITRPENVYRHRWRPGDLVIFDNRAVLHTATPYDYPDERRLMWQIIVGGRDRDAP